MRTIKSIILLISIGLFSCKSENPYKEFQPATLGYIKSIKYDCISVDSLKETKNLYKSIYEYTYFDSIYNALSKKCSDKRDYNGMDSIDRLRFSERKHGILKFRILRLDSTNTTKAIVYEDLDLDGNFNSGYWVALSKDDGGKWKYYYTGITKANFYYFKCKSTIPLFINDSVIQIESSLVRQVSPRGFPIGSPEYELLKDGLIISINLNKLTLDSDNDGLTDIEERKILTNPFKADTDNDGIIDGKDSNPRFKNINSDLSTLIGYLLEGDWGRGDSHFLKLDYTNKLDKTYQSNRFAQLVVTDDSRIINLSKTQNTYIFATESELTDYLKTTPVPPSRLGIEIKRVGIFTEEYNIIISKSTWSIKYLARKVKTGWQITIEETIQT